MKYAIVGGNSRIGTELCFVLRRFDVEPIPIVRNPMGAAFLRYHNFQCRIADISKEEAAMKALDDLDIVIVAAYDTRWGREGRATNAKIVTNSLKYSPDSSKMIYFSSIRAFSRQIDKSTPRWWMAPAHDREKRYLESHQFTESKKYGKDAYAFRIGHVYGRNQVRTRQLLEYLSRANPNSTIGVSRGSASNVLHIVSLADAIILCARQSIPKGIYALVNTPQWSWGDVFEYYAPAGTPLKFLEEERNDEKHSTRKGILRSLYTRVRRNKSVVSTLKTVLPEGVRKDYSRRFQREEIISEIEGLERDKPLHMHEFDYRPVPGPQLPGLMNTKTLLETRDVPEGIFN